LPRPRYAFTRTIWTSPLSRRRGIEHSCFDGEPVRHEHPRLAQYPHPHLHAACLTLVIITCFGIGRARTPRSALRQVGRKNQSASKEKFSPQHKTPCVVGPGYQPDRAAEIAGRPGAAATNANHRARISNVQGQQRISRRVRNGQPDCVTCRLRPTAQSSERFSNRAIPLPARCSGNHRQLARQVNLRRENGPNGYRGSDRDFICLSPQLWPQWPGCPTTMGATIEPAAKAKAGVLMKSRRVPPNDFWQTSRHVSLSHLPSAFQLLGRLRIVHRFRRGEATQPFPHAFSQLGFKDSQSTRAKPLCRWIYLPPHETPRRPDPETSERRVCPSCSRLWRGTSNFESTCLLKIAPTVMVHSELSLGCR